MNSMSTYVAAAALAIGGVAFVGCEREESVSTTTTTTTPGADAARVDADRAENKMENAAERTGNAAEQTAENAAATAENAAETAGSAVKSGASKVSGAVQDLTSASPDRIRGVFAEVAEAALAKDGVDDLVERFVDADRNRLGQGGLDQGNDQLNALIGSIAADWKAKYNAEFDIQNVENVYTQQFMSVKAGEQGGNANVAIDVDRNLPAGETTRINVGAQKESGVDDPSSASADANRNDPGRNIATVNVMASQGTPAVSVPLIHEAGGWKIDVPDSLDAAKLRANLIEHLTAVQNMKAQWPATADEAYRAVTHHVLMAVMDKPAK